MGPWFDVDAAVADLDAVTRQLDALFGQRGLDGRHGLRTLGTEVELAVRELPEAWEITAELPGVAAEQVQLAFADGTLTLKAERKVARPEGGGGKVRYAERPSFAVDRAVRLPEGVDPEGIAAAFTHGVLTVTLPKRAQAQPRTIPVQTA
ncbi:MAG: Hsp20/alpha crystallin family protein [Myxococcota bacterium]